MEVARSNSKKAGARVYLESLLVNESLSQRLSSAVPIDYRANT